MQMRAYLTQLAMLGLTGEMSLLQEIKAHI
jgi:hypothetical protein